MFGLGVNVEEGVEISQWRGDGRGAFVDGRGGEAVLERTRNKRSAFQVLLLLHSILFPRQLCK